MEFFNEYHKNLLISVKMNCQVTWPITSSLLKATDAIFKENGNHPLTGCLDSNLDIPCFTARD